MFIEGILGAIASPRVIRRATDRQFPTLATVPCSFAHSSIDRISFASACSRACASARSRIVQGTQGALETGDSRDGGSAVHVRSASAYEIAADRVRGRSGYDTSANTSSSWQRIIGAEIPTHRCWADPS